MASKFIGVTLPIRRGQTGMFEVSTNIVSQTKSNLINLLLTKKGERLAQPTLGCDLWKIVFEQLTEETVERARLAVLDSVEEWLSYLQVTNFTITPNNNSNTLTIKCTYVFKNNPNVKDSVTLYTNELNQLSAGLNAPENSLGFTTRTGEQFTTTTGQIRRRRGVSPYLMETVKYTGEEEFSNIS